MGLTLTLLGAVVGFVLFGFVVWGSKRQGRLEAQLKQEKKTHEAHAKTLNATLDVLRKVDSLPYNPNLLKRVREKFRRPFGT